jgi:arylformamidase
MVDYTAEYDNSARVEGADVLIATYADDAAEFRQSEGLIADLNVQYGKGERNKLDIFWPSEDRDAPLSVFIHGGYWQQMDRSAFSHLAKGLLANGIAVAMPSYTLAPDIKIAGIIAEIGRACTLLHRTYQRPLTIFGHSAGGHLAACMMAVEWPDPDNADAGPVVQSGMGISGIYDLAPLIETPINDALGLNAFSAKSASPLHWLPPALHKFEAWVGGDESDEYHRQSIALTNNWTMAGTSTRYASVRGANHFTIIDQLTDPESEMTQQLVDLVFNPMSTVEVPQPNEELVTMALAEFAVGNGLAVEESDESGEADEGDEEIAEPPVEDERPAD